MISKEEIKKLAELARIEITDTEAEKLKSDMGAILDYVGQVKEVVGDNSDSSAFPSPQMRRGRHEVRGEVVNVMREDADPTEPGTYSQEIINEFPEREGDYLKVKKIL